MSEHELSAEERIIRATINCIEAEGLERTTIRRIADIAGVNSAAINYYFRSKQRLIRTALDVSLANAFDWKDFAASESASAVERLVHIMSELMRGAMAYPRLARAHLDGARPASKDRSGAMEAVRRFLGELEVDLQNRGVSVDAAILRRQILQVFNAAVVAVIYVPDLFTSYAAVNVDDEDQVERYVRSIVESLFAARA